MMPLIQTYISKYTLVYAMLNSDMGQILTIHFVFLLLRNLFSLSRDFLCGIATRPVWEKDVR